MHGRLDFRYHGSSTIASELARPSTTKTTEGISLGSLMF